MTIYLIFCLVMFTFLFTIWNGRNSYLNLFLKLAFLVAAVTAGLLLAQALGYIIKI